MWALSGLFLGWLFAEASGYVFHRALHSRLTGPLHRAHLNHHDEQYPPGDFLSNEYRSAGKDSTLWPFLSGGLFVAVLVLWLLPLEFAVPFLTALLLSGLAANYVHDATHVRDHFLERYKWFWRLRRMHKIHHEQPTRNFGIYSFHVDGVCGTFEGKTRR